jgi:hypothetical protein
MALMQMEYSGLTEQYFISSFIARLKNGTKHYLVPHSPQALSATYWQAKKLEKEILVKKSLLHPYPTYPKPTPLSTATTNPVKPNPAQPKPASQNQANKPLPIKPREPGKCWGCQEP